MNEEQAKAAAEAVSTILTATLSRLDKLNEIAERIADAQQQRLSEQQHANKNMLDNIRQLLKGLAPQPPAPFVSPMRPAVENRCTATDQQFGVQCELDAGHIGTHSGMLMWTDAASNFPTKQ